MKNTLVKTHSSFQHRARTLLEMPLHKRPVWFWALSPLLFFISVVVAVVAFLKRKKILNPEILGASRPQVVCVGNVLIGGSGKSPLVRALARDLLKQGKIVGIAARGMGVSSRAPAHFIVRAGEQHPHRHFLSDENAEHLELLELEFLTPESAGSAALFVCQGPSRKTLYALFQKALELQGLNASNAVFVLDDGLQHVQMPRDLDVCVWDPGVLARAPCASFPVGPYREGFFGGWGGVADFSDLLKAFPVRVWSRCGHSPEAFATFQIEIEKALERFDQKPHETTDLLVAGRISFVHVKQFLWQPIKLESEAFQNQIVHASKQNTILVLTGIARPERFLDDLQNIFLSALGSRVNLRHLALADHAPLSSDVVAALKQCTTLLVTAKDFFRWRADPLFTHGVSEASVIVCVVETVVKKYAGANTSLAVFLNQPETSCTGKS